MTLFAISAVGLLMAGSTAAQMPEIEFLHVPPYRSEDNLVGRVRHANPDSFQVAAYIFVEGAGWWSKPSAEQPWTAVRSDSTWKVDITTGGSDIFATRLVAALFGREANVDPVVQGAACLPEHIEREAAAVIRTERTPRTLLFSNYTWRVKASATPVGPGSTRFSEAPDHVWVDEEGFLHLRLAPIGETWYGSEVILAESLGYGRYTFTIEGAVGELPESVVLGLFTWDNDACEVPHREIDIEFSRWGVPTDPNAQYVVQPHDTAGNRFRWSMPADVTLSTHIFHWTPDSISFLSVKGGDLGAPVDSVLQRWRYTGPHVPTPGSENARINLWLFSEPPATGVEVVVRRFAFEPHPTMVETSQNPEAPVSFRLLPNYPNPFNAVTRIPFVLKRKANVTLSIYDVRGSEVGVLIDGEVAAGAHEALWDASDLPSGVYLARLRVGKRTQVRKLLLLR